MNYFITEILQSLNAYWVEMLHKYIGMASSLCFTGGSYSVVSALLYDFSHELKFVCVFDIYILENVKVKVKIML